MHGLFASGDLLKFAMGRLKLERLCNQNVNKGRRVQLGRCTSDNDRQTRLYRAYRLRKLSLIYRTQPRREENSVEPDPVYGAYGSMNGINSNALVANRSE